MKKSEKLLLNRALTTILGRRSFILFYFHEQRITTTFLKRLSQFKQFKGNCLPVFLDLKLNLKIMLVPPL
jgi:hypothetical protein